MNQQVYFREIMTMKSIFHITITKLLCTGSIDKIADQDFDCSKGIGQERGRLGGVNMSGQGWRDD